jgi:hypothetical protein
MTLYMSGQYVRFRTPDEDDPDGATDVIVRGSITGLLYDGDDLYYEIAGDDGVAYEIPEEDVEGFA